MGIIFLCLLNSCGDPTEIGTDLFDDEELFLEFTDTISLQAKTVIDDSLLVYLDGAVRATSLLFGQIDDPVFGTTKANILSTVIRNPNITPELTGSNIRIDSLILSLEFGNANNYGDSTQNSYSIDVFRVEEDLRLIDEAYSSYEPILSADPIASVSNYRLNFDSLNVYNTLLDTIVTEDPQIRIPFSEEFEAEFLDLVLNNQTDSLFNEAFKGIYVTLSDDANLLTSINFQTQIDSKISMYYSIDDSLVTYNFIPEGIQFNTYDIENETTIIDADDSFDNGGEFLYLKSNVGTTIEVDMSNLNSLDGLLLNLVELEFTLVEQNVGNIDFYPPIPNLLARTFNDEGVLEVIEDINVIRILSNSSSVSSAALEDFFGGNVREEVETGLKKYKLNLTRFVKASLENDGEVKNLIIDTYLKSQVLNRSVIYGPNHELYPMKLNVTYTLQ